MISLWKNTGGEQTPDDVRYRGITLEQRRYREIQKAAYLIWIEKGGGNHHDVEDWLTAESLIDNDPNSERL